MFVTAVLVAGCYPQEGKLQQSYYIVETGNIESSFYGSEKTYALMESDPRSEGEDMVIIDNIKNTIYGENADEVIADYELLTNTKDAAYILGRVGHVGGDHVYRSLEIFDFQKQDFVETPLSELFENRNGILVRIQEQNRWIWAPLMEGGVPIDADTIYMLDLNTDSYSVLVRLEAEETLDGSDPCDTYSNVADMSLGENGVRYAVYSRTDRDNLYFHQYEACTQPLNLDEQRVKANDLLIEYRTVELP
ncbi:MAG: hypothetical protein PHU04_02935 [Candidatus Peribacteraceae bacterium]|nr:hypothetical protein [Candidatus Peribacteraceae bacterium]